VNWFIKVSKYLRRGVTWVVDLGSGSYCRGDVCVDIDFTWFNPFHRPEQYDFLAPRTELNDKVVADLNYPLPFRDECFSKVVMVHVLEHLHTPSTTLKEVYRVLRRGGLLLVVVPNAQTNNADWLDEEHVYSFTPPTLCRLVSKYFKVIKLEYILNNMDILLEAVKDSDVDLRICTSLEPRPRVEYVYIEKKLVDDEEAVVEFLKKFAKKVLKKFKSMLRLQ